MRTTATPKKTARSGPAKTRRLPARIALAVVTILVTCAAVELGTYVWLWQLASDEQFASYATLDQIRRTKELTVTRHHYLPFIPTPNHRKGNNRHNAHGYRGDEIEVPKPTDVYRIVLLGGSTTYTTRVLDYRGSYPYLLQNLLRERGHQAVEVVNAGVGKYSSWESLLNLQLRVLDLNPDLVIVYHGINDVHTRLVYPFEAYRGDNSGARAAYAEPREKLWDASTFLRIVRTNLGLRQPIAGAGFYRTHDLVPECHATEFRLQRKDGSYPSGVFATMPAAEMLRVNKPIYFERNLRNMWAICRAHGIDMVLMTFASSTECGKYPFVSSPEYQAAFAEQNQVVRKICLSSGIPCFDFAKAMPSDRWFWRDGRHVSEAGAALKAELVADFLEGLALLPD